MPTNGDSAIFFTGNIDPRDNNILVGNTITAAQQRFPILFEFKTEARTQIGSGTVQGAKTTVTRQTADVVARMQWSPTDQLGMMQIWGRPVELPMTYFYMPLPNGAPTSNGRLFLSRDNKTYEWRRLENQPDEYDLLTVGPDPPPERIATFRREYVMQTPVGRVHAVMKYNFSDELLLLESVVALAINRRMHGGWLVG